VVPVGNIVTLLAINLILILYTQVLYQYLQ
jgi:hypothetical protein